MNPAHESKAAKLARIARPLKPAAVPFYVQHARDDAPLMGWWWRPAGADRAEPLGMSYEAALVALSLKLNSRVAA